MVVGVEVPVCLQTRVFVLQDLQDAAVKQVHKITQSIVQILALCSEMLSTDS